MSKSPVGLLYPTHDVMGENHCAFNSELLRGEQQLRAGPEAPLPTHGGQLGRVAQV